MTHRRGWGSSLRSAATSRALLPTGRTILSANARGHTVLRVKEVGRRRRKKPTLINYYLRQYWVSADQRIRATVDYDNVAFDQRMTSAPNISRPLLQPDMLILECKSPIEHREQLADAVSRLPLRTTKHSKYVEAVNHFCG